VTRKYSSHCVYSIIQWHYYIPCKHNFFL